MPTTTLLPDHNCPGRVAIVCSAGEDLTLYPSFENFTLATQENHLAPLIDGHACALEEKQAAQAVALAT